MSARHVSYFNARGELIDNAYRDTPCSWPHRVTCPGCKARGYTFGVEDKSGEPAPHPEERQ